METEKIYILIRVGNYRHEIVGCFRDRKQAINEAESICSQEPDDWHSIDVLECYVNNAGHDFDGETVASWKRERLGKFTYGQAQFAKESLSQQVLTSDSHDNAAPKPSNARQT